MATMPSFCCYTHIHTHTHTHTLYSCWCSNVSHRHYSRITMDAICKVLLARELLTVQYENLTIWEVPEIYAYLAYESARTVFEGPLVPSRCSSHHAPHEASMCGPCPVDGREARMDLFCCSAEIRGQAHLRTCSG
jgi:hypothetical protein